MLCCPVCALHRGLTRAPGAQILIIMTLLVRILSFLPAMAGLGVTVLLIPATTLLAKKQAAIRKVP